MLKKRFTLIMRVPAFLTLSAFLANSAAGAQSLPHTHAIQAPGAYGLSRSPESLKVPPRWGMLEKFHPQPQKPLAILIQDAHAVLPAQENIENLILHAVRAYGAGFAALEGGSGALDVLIWKKFPDQQRLEESLKKYFEQSELTGGQIAAVTEKNGIPFYGIEDWQTYEQHTRVYLRALDQRDSALERLEEHRRKLDAERRLIFTQEQNALHETARRFRLKEIDLALYLQALARRLPREEFKNYPCVQLVLNLAQEEKKQESEAFQKALPVFSDKIKHQLQSAPAPASADGLMLLNQKRQAFDQGTLSAGDFLFELSRLAGKQGVRLDLSSHHKTALRLRRKIQNLQGQKLWEELERLEKAAMGIFKADDGQKKLAAQYQRLDGMELLVKLELTRSQWDEGKLDGRFSRKPGDQKQGEAAHELRPRRTAVPEPKLARARAAKPPAEAGWTNLSPFVEFYRLAEMRDEKIFENFKKKLESSGRSGVLVAGGFHMPALIQKLEAAGYGYALVTPRIEALPEESHYEPIMRGELSYASRGTKETLFDAFTRKMSKQLLENRNPRDSAQILKLWREQVIRGLAEIGQLDRARFYTEPIDLLIREHLQQYGAQNLSARSGGQLLEIFDKTIEQFADRFLKTQKIGTSVSALGIDLGAMIPGQPRMPAPETPVPVMAEPGRDSSARARSELRSEKNVSSDTIAQKILEEFRKDSSRVLLPTPKQISGSAHRTKSEIRRLYPEILKHLEVLSGRLAQNEHALAERIRAAVGRYRNPHQDAADYVLRLFEENANHKTIPTLSEITRELGKKEDYLGYHQIEIYEAILGRVMDFGTDAELRRRVLQALDMHRDFPQTAARWVLRHFAENPGLKTFPTTPEFEGALGYYKQKFGEQMPQIAERLEKLLTQDGIPAPLRARVDLALRVKENPSLAAAIYLLEYFEQNESADKMPPHLQMKEALGLSISHVLPTAASILETLLTDRDFDPFLRLRLTAMLEAWKKPKPGRTRKNFKIYPVVESSVEEIRDYLKARAYRPIAGQHYLQMEFGEQLIKQAKAGDLTVIRQALDILDRNDQEFLFPYAISALRHFSDQDEVVKRVGIALARLQAHRAAGNWSRVGVRLQQKDPERYRQYLEIVGRHVFKEMMPRYLVWLHEQKTMGDASAVKMLDLLAQTLQEAVDDGQFVKKGYPARIGKLLFTQEAQSQRQLAETFRIGQSEISRYLNGGMKKGGYSEGLLDDVYERLRKKKSPVWQSLQSRFREEIPGKVILFLLEHMDADQQMPYAMRRDVQKRYLYYVVDELAGEENGLLSAEKAAPELKAKIKDSGHTIDRDEYYADSSALQLRSQDELNKAARLMEAVQGHEDRVTVSIRRDTSLLEQPFKLGSYVYSLQSKNVRRDAFDPRAHGHVKRFAVSGKTHSKEQTLQRILEFVLQRHTQTGRLPQLQEVAAAVSIEPAALSTADEYADAIRRELELRDFPLLPAEWSTMRSRYEQTAAVTVLLSETARGTLGAQADQVFHAAFYGENEVQILGRTIRGLKNFWENFETAHQTAVSKMEFRLTPGGLQIFIIAHNRFGRRENYTALLKVNSGGSFEGLPVSADYDLTDLLLQQGQEVAVPVIGSKVLFKGQSFDLAGYLGKQGRFDDEVRITAQHAGKDGYRFRIYEAYGAQRLLGQWSRPAGTEPDGSVPEILDLQPLGAVRVSARDGLISLGKWFGGEREFRANSFLSLLGIPYASVRVYLERPDSAAQGGWMSLRIFDAQNRTEKTLLRIPLSSDGYPEPRKGLPEPSTKPAPGKTQYSVLALAPLAGTISGAVFNFIEGRSKIDPQLTGQLLPDILAAEEKLPMDYYVAPGADKITINDQGILGGWDNYFEQIQDEILRYQKAGDRIVAMGMKREKNGMTIYAILKSMHSIVHYPLDILEVTEEGALAAFPPRGNAKVTELLRQRKQTARPLPVLGSGKFWLNNSFYTLKPLLDYLEKTPADAAVMFYPEAENPRVEISISGHPVQIINLNEHYLPKVLKSNHKRVMYAVMKLLVRQLEGDGPYFKTAIGLDPYRSRRVFLNRDEIEKELRRRTGEGLSCHARELWKKKSEGGNRQLLRSILLHNQAHPGEEIPLEGDISFLSAGGRVGFFNGLITREDAETLLEERQLAGLENTATALGLALDAGGDRTLLAFIRRWNRQHPDDRIILDLHAPDRAPRKVQPYETPGELWKREVSEMGELSNEEREGLWHQRNSDPKAREKLILSFLPFITRFAQDAAGTEKGGYRFEYLVQNGNLILLTVLDQWTSSQGTLTAFVEEQIKKGMRLTVKKGGVTHSDSSSYWSLNAPRGGDPNSGEWGEIVSGSLGWGLGDDGAFGDWLNQWQQNPGTTGVTPDSVSPQSPELPGYQPLDDDIWEAARREQAEQDNPMPLQMFKDSMPEISHALDVARARDQGVRPIGYHEKKELAEKIQNWFLNAGLKEAAANQGIGNLAIYIVGSLGNLGNAVRSYSDINLMIVTDADPLKTQAIHQVIVELLGAEHEEDRSRVSGHMGSLGKHGGYDLAAAQKKGFISILQQHQIGNPQKGFASIETVRLEQNPGEPSTVFADQTRAAFHMGFVDPDWPQSGINGILVFQNHPDASEHLARIAGRYLTLDQVRDYWFRFLHDQRENTLDARLAQNGQKVSKPEPGVFEGVRAGFSRIPADTVQTIGTALFTEDGALNATRPGAERGTAFLFVHGQRYLRGKFHGQRDEIKYVTAVEKFFPNNLQSLQAVVFYGLNDLDEFERKMKRHEEIFEGREVIFLKASEQDVLLSRVLKQRILWQQEGPHSTLKLLDHPSSSVLPVEADATAGRSELRTHEGASGDDPNAPDRKLDLPKIILVDLNGSSLTEVRSALKNAGYQAFRHTTFSDASQQIDTGFVPEIVILSPAAEDSEFKADLLLKAPSADILTAADLGENPAQAIQNRGQKSRGERYVAKQKFLRAAAETGLRTGQSFQTSAALYTLLSAQDHPEHGWSFNLRIQRQTGALEIRTLIPEHFGAFNEQIQRESQKSKRVLQEQSLITEWGVLKMETAIFEGEHLDGFPSDQKSGPVQGVFAVTITQDGHFFSGLRANLTAKGLFHVSMATFFKVQGKGLMREVFSKGLKPYLKPGMIFEGTLLNEQSLFALAAAVRSDDEFIKRLPSGVLQFVLKYNPQEPIKTLAQQVIFLAIRQGYQFSQEQILKTASAKSQVAAGLERFEIYVETRRAAGREQFAIYIRSHAPSRSELRFASTEPIKLAFRDEVSKKTASETLEFVFSPRFRAWVRQYAVTPFVKRGLLQKGGQAENAAAVELVQMIRRAMLAEGVPLDSSLIGKVQRLTPEAFERFNGQIEKDFRLFVQNQGRSPDGADLALRVGEQESPEVQQALTQLQSEIRSLAVLFPKEGRPGSWKGFPVTLNRFESGKLEKTLRLLKGNSPGLSLFATEGEPQDYQGLSVMSIFAPLQALPENKELRRSVILASAAVLIAISLLQQPEELLKNPEQFRNFLLHHFPSLAESFIAANGSASADLSRMVMAIQAAARSA